MAKLKSSYTSGEKIKWYNYFGILFGSCSINIDLPDDPAMLYLNEMRIYVHTQICTGMFIAALIIIKKDRNNPHVYYLMSRSIKCGLFI